MSRSAAFLLALVLSLPAAAQVDGRMAVVDGDTLKLGEERIRLHGIDAPEKDQLCRRGNGAEYHCGAVALVRLEEFIAGRPVVCTGAERDRYKRLVARCSVAGADLSAWLVAQGWATAYVKYSREYLPQEHAARSRKLGLWAGTFVAPSDWRKGER